jgi:hypothetical protein
MIGARNASLEAHELLHTADGADHAAIWQITHGVIERARATADHDYRARCTLCLDGPPSARTWACTAI